MFLVFSTVLLAALLVIKPKAELVRQVAATTVLLVLPKANAVSRGHGRLSFLSNVLITTIRDMGSFLVIMLFIMADFAFGFAVLAGFDGDYASLPEIAFDIYALQLGDFEQDSFRPSAGYTLATLFGGFTFLVNIVALNSLIALMGDSWAKTQETADARGLQQKAELLLELEHDLSAAEHVDKNLFPSWVHCLQPLCDSDDGADEVWQGRVVALRKNLDANVKETVARIENVREQQQQRLDAVEANIVDRLKEMKFISTLSSGGHAASASDVKQAEIEAKLAEIDAKLTRLLA